MSALRSAGRVAPSAYFAFVNLGMTVVVLGPALPYLAANTGSSLGAISYLFMAQNIGYILGSFISGRLYDRLPAGRLISGSFLAMIPALLLTPFSRTLALLLPLIAVLGFLQGTVDVGGNFLILRTPPRGRGLRMNALHMFFGVGALLAPLAMSQAVRWSGGIGWGFGALAAGMLAAGLWMLRLPGFHGQQPESGPAGAQAQARPLLVVLVVVFLFLGVGAETAFGGWIYTYASRRGLADAAQAFYLNSLFWFSLTIGRLIATLLARRLRSRSLLLASLAGCLAASAMLLAWPTAAVAWVSAAAFGLFIGPLVANMITLAGEAIPVSGSVTGFFVVGFSLGGIALPWLIGQLFEPLGPGAFPAVLLSSLALAGICLRFFLTACRLAAKAARSR